METPGGQVGTFLEEFPVRVRSAGPHPWQRLGSIELQCMVESSLIRTHSPPLHTAGNIGALKDMPLTALDLSCTAVKGRPGYHS